MFLYFKNIKIQFNGKKSSFDYRDKKVFNLENGTGDLFLFLTLKYLILRTRGTRLDSSPRQHAFPPSTNATKFQFHNTITHAFAFSLSLSLSCICIYAHNPRVACQSNSWLTHSLQHKHGNKIIPLFIYINPPSLEFEFIAKSEPN